MVAVTPYQIGARAHLFFSTERTTVRQSEKNIRNRKKYSVIECERIKVLDFCADDRNRRTTKTAQCDVSDCSLNMITKYSRTIWSRTSVTDVPGLVTRNEQSTGIILGHDGGYVTCARKDGMRKPSFSAKPSANLWVSYFCAYNF